MEKQIYEIGFHILPTVAEEALGDEVSKIRTEIEKGGEVISEEYPKLQDLEYSISKYIDTKKSKFDRAYFGWIKFEGDAELALSIKKVCDNHSNILRYLIIKTVRENTLVKPKEPKKEGEVEGKEFSKEEVDKSIDELVIE
ncbi:MAG: 30S ribosomal protein S6 [Candidatus Pacebacteria bacterium]|nr:30S ribosomal protein S6 [Candidatus Paceibacterota bacterium]